ncbi:hypothetical protein CC85DRAFT_283159 [Cutaneotrichosporon oleaginosum]|uniref:Uncharacterized protein n=1 Tax=Cutaneotrichosporon oleaginosum TaxID=879819 RepID=A0A0J0XUX9_9TREE|nr:uncharacterized protein CC85DRAFT_283159 [Cutaneotrichosporon oleaginosum]KLT44857.1 hypothetical protein CC85DRAFT_283159 [Cutaneotrichosporon oleaginosum]TXT11992.1 hypothetical protein COLE_02402 [Cutaneotrichosporon oleaginosum]
MSAGSEHAHAAPVGIPESGGHADMAITELVAAFEAHDFRNDQEFRAGLPAVIKSVKGRGASAADIDDVIARAQWFYFTRKQQTQVPFEVYLERRTGETESVPMGSSVTSGTSASSAPTAPPTFQSQPPNGAFTGAHGLAPPSSDPPPFSSRPPSPPQGASAAVASALPARFDTDGEGGITVERVCTSIPASRNTTPPPRDTTPQARPELGVRAPSTGGSTLPTPGLTESEASTPDVSGMRIENRVAVAAEMAVPAADAPVEAEIEASNAPGPIETTAPGPDGPQMPFDEVVRLISTGRAGEVPHHEIPEGLNEEPASEAKMASRPKPWERAASSTASAQTADAAQLAEQ